MKKTIKYLLLILLFLFLVVNDSYPNHSIITSSYFQVSLIKGDQSAKYHLSEVYIFGNQNVSLESYPYQISNYILKTIYSDEMNLVYKLQSNQHLQVRSVITRYIFLDKKIESILQNNFYT